MSAHDVSDFRETKTGYKKVIPLFNNVKIGTEHVQLSSLSLQHFFSIAEDQLCYYFYRFFFADQ